MIKDSLKVGLSFGFTSAIITTLGLITGLNAGTQSRVAVIGGVLTIAIADAFSDALGIHVSEESEGKHGTREIWESTIAAFLAKFAFASLFLVPLVLLPLESAIIASIVMGLSLLAVLSFYVAKSQGASATRAIAEHLFVAIVVIVITIFVGNLIARTFGNSVM
jgi:vacuolar iron transporter family protein